MIRNEKLKDIAIAAIAVLMLLAAVPAGVAAVTLFEDDFQLPSWASNWDDSLGPLRVCPAFNCYLSFWVDGDDIESVLINATCMKNIVVSYDRMTSDFWGESGDKHFQSYYSTDGGIIWFPLENISWSSNWTTKTYNLSVAANDNPNLRLRFCADIGSSFAEYANLDNVTVTGEPMDPKLEVNKTVWNGTAWVKSLDAKINDTLRFKSTIRNTGNINLTEIRFWDILDCSLNYSGNATLNGEPFTCFETESYPFKPKVLHIYWYYLPEWTPGSDPVGGFFRELCPSYDTYYEIVGWEDTGDKGNVSACDQIQLVSSEADLSSEAVFEDDFENPTLSDLKWDYSDMYVTNLGAPNDYALFEVDTGDLKSVPIDATCNMNLVLSFDVMTVNWDYDSTWDYDQDHFYVNYSSDNLTWTTLADINETIDWTTFTYTLPCTVNNQNLWLWFSAVEGNDPENQEFALLDNVSITCQGWYHVDRVPYTLALYNETFFEYYFDSVHDWYEVNLSNPNQTQWFGLCGCKDTYTLLNWTDPSIPGFGMNDPVTMRNERTLEEVQYTVSVVGHDLVLSREWEIASLLEPEANITIEYNATVVRYGVDNNTLSAKGFGECGDNWKYSDPDVVTITVQSPESGGAQYEMAIDKTVWDPVTGTWLDEIDAQVGDIVHFKINFTCKNVSQLCDLENYRFSLVDEADPDIFILDSWDDSENESNDIYYRNTTLSFRINRCGKGINNATMIAECQLPGTAMYEPVDRIRDIATVNVECPEAPEVPALTPIGLTALVGLLSAIAVIAIVRKRH
jgi:uncharacterized repeat protein (TIGR01451 family)